MMKTQHLELAERARLRNASLWINFDWGGLMEPVSGDQTALVNLNRTMGESYLVIIDDNWDLKESQRDRGAELDRAEVAQDQLLAEERVALGRTKLAIRQATDEYVLAAQIYDAKVRALLQATREYAAQVELEQLAVERDRSILAVEKEGHRLLQINAKIYYEVIQRAQVEADLARAQLDVAKAHVRVVMSEIEAGKAEIDLIEAEVQQALAQAEKATLQADVATIWAEIVVKKLSEIKLDVERQEIQLGFAVLEAKLADMLALWDTRKLTEEYRKEAEVEILKEIQLTEDAEKAQEDLRRQEIENGREVFDYEVTQTDVNLEDERYLRGSLLDAKKAMAHARIQHTIRQREKATWAEKLLNEARRWTYKNQYRFVNSFDARNEYISGG